MRRTEISEAAGFTVVETLIAIILSGLVLAAVMSSLRGHQRFYRHAGDVAEAKGTLERLDEALAPTLLPVNPATGDIYHADTDSIELRAFRGTFVACDIASGDGDLSLTVRRLTPGGTPQAGDSALVYTEGATAEFDDDGWSAIVATSVSDATCPDGSSAWLVTDESPPAGLAGSIPDGAPVRIFRRASYWFATGEGGLHLMTDARSGSATSLAGPLAGDPAPTLRYLDADGASATGASITRIELDAAAVLDPSKGDSGPTSQQTLSFRLRNN